MSKPDHAYEVILVVLSPPKPTEVVIVQEEVVSR